MCLHCALCSISLKLIRLKKMLNFDLLTPSPGSGGESLVKMFATILLHL